MPGSPVSSYSTSEVPPVQLAACPIPRGLLISLLVSCLATGNRYTNGKTCPLSWNHPAPCLANLIFHQIRVTCLMESTVWPSNPCFHWPGILCSSTLKAIYHHPFTLHIQDLLPHYFALFIQTYLHIDVEIMYLAHIYKAYLFFCLGLFLFCLCSNYSFIGNIQAALYYNCLVSFCPSLLT